MVYKQKGKAHATKLKANAIYVQGSGCHRVARNTKPGMAMQRAGPWKAARPGASSDCAACVRASSHTSMCSAPAASATPDPHTLDSRPKVMKREGSSDCPACVRQSSDTSMCHALSASARCGKVRTDILRVVIDSLLRSWRLRLRLGRLGVQPPCQMRTILDIFESSCQRRSSLAHKPNPA